MSDWLNLINYFHYLSLSNCHIIFKNTNNDGSLNSSNYTNTVTEQAMKENNLQRGQRSTGNGIHKTVLYI